MGGEMSSRSKRLLRTLAVIAIVAAAGGAAFVVGTRLRGDGTSEAQAPRSEDLSQKIDAAQTAIAADAGKPTFTGELLGIAFAPTVDQWPADVRKKREELSTAFATCGPDTVMPPNPFPFKNPLSLPAKFAPAGALAAGSPEVVSRCGKVTGVNWEYEAVNEDGTPASVYIGRGFGRELLYDGSANRISVTTVGGLPAVVIAPVTPGGLVQTGLVAFPEPFGMMTHINTFNLSEADLLAVAERVAAAIGGGAR
jgi:hypothetical protein